MSQLADLEPELVVVDGDSWRPVASLAEAQGVLFICPVCRTHSVLAWFRGRGVPSSLGPGPGRWTPSGTGIADLTLTPSIALLCWHGFVRDGAIV